MSPKRVSGTPREWGVTGQHFRNYCFAEYSKHYVKYFKHTSFNLYYNILKQVLQYQDHFIVRVLRLREYKTCPQPYSNEVAEPGFQFCISDMEAHICSYFAISPLKLRDAREMQINL